MLISGGREAPAPTFSQEGRLENALPGSDSRSGIDPSLGSLAHLALKKNPAADDWADISLPGTVALESSSEDAFWAIWLG
jgi:hypothetical protein